MYPVAHETKLDAVASSCIAGIWFGFQIAKNRPRAVFCVVGEPGIEPGPLGPKPSTLPLCYTPSKKLCGLLTLKCTEVHFVWLAVKI